MTAQSTVFPSHGRLAGIDYGHRRVGISICDPQRILASPYENYERRNEQLDSDYFSRLVQQEQIVGFVVGLPVYASGNESQKSHEARQFGAWLQQVTAAPVCFFDERYTTKQAESILMGAKLTSAKRKKRRDMLAAQLILAAYLESPHAAGSAAALDDPR